MKSGNCATSASSCPVAPSVDAAELRDLALSASRYYCRDYNDQQDLASQALIAALEYDRPIEFPKRFMRMVVRNILLNHARSVSSRELTGCDIELEESLEVSTSAGATGADPALQMILSDTLSRMEARLTAREKLCYNLLRQGHDRSELPALLGVTRQATCQLLSSIRRKYLAEESADVESRRLSGGL